MPPLFIATQNPGKLAEIHDLLQKLAAPLKIELVSPAQLGLHLEVSEDGHSYAENAGRKALAYCQASKLVTLADDSGLEVEALGGEPGIYSARYGDETSLAQRSLSDRDRRSFLLQQIAARAAPRPWRARFRCTVAIAAPGIESPDSSVAPARDPRIPNLHFFEGTCSGEIIPEERGSGGFGYDPIFLLPELGRTMAELSMAEKNQLSHRARAIQAAWRLIERLIR